MEHLFADYEVSTLVKEKGFDEPCLAIYQIFETYGEKGIIEIGELQIQTIKKGFKSDTSIAAPLWDQIIEWLETKNIWLSITPPFDDLLYEYSIYRINKNNKLGIRLGNGFDIKIKQEARRTAILHALTLI